MHLSNKIIGYIFLGLLLIGMGFFVGRMSKKISKPEKIIEYIPGETVTDTLYKERIVKITEKEPVDTVDLIKRCVADGKFYDLFPYKKYDTTIVLDKGDSTAIMMDWATERTYAGILFNSDTLGRCDYTALVQYNELKSLGYEYTPMQKSTTTETFLVKHISPFVGVGISLFPSVKAEFGIYIDDSWGFAIEGRWYPRSNEIQGLPQYDIGLGLYKKF